jgi:hypothetical protein
MSQHGVSPEPRFEGTVAAAFPLALLEAVRAHDRPGEILEDEDLAVSLPRRLGLTGVVETQIMRYEADQRTGRTVSLNEVMSLFKLVMRRPDAEPILRETGQRVARWSTRHTPAVWLTLLHRGPARLALRSARRAAVRVLRRLHAGSRIDAAKPFTVTVTDCVTARLEDSGSGCALFTGVMEEQLLFYTGNTVRVTHSACMVNGGDICEWRAEE